MKSPCLVRNGNIACRHDGNLRSNASIGPCQDIPRCKNIRGHPQSLRAACKTRHRGHHGGVPRILTQTALVIKLILVHVSVRDEDVCRRFCSYQHAVHVEPDTYEAFPEHDHPCLINKSKEYFNKIWGKVHSHLAILKKRKGTTSIFPLDRIISIISSTLN